MFRKRRAKPEALRRSLKTLDLESTGIRQPTSAVTNRFWTGFHDEFSAELPAEFSLNRVIPSRSEFPRPYPDPVIPKRARYLARDGDGFG